MIQRGVKTIANQVIDDLVFFAELGLSRDHVVDAALHVNRNRCMVGTSMSIDEVKIENEKIKNLALALLAFDRDPDPKEKTADLDLASMNTVTLAGVGWTRSNDLYWRPDDASQAEGAQYPFKDDELMAWFKLQPAQS